MFSVVSPSTSAIADALPWIQRLMHAYGSPNLSNSMELCGWGRFAAMYTWGIPVGLPGTAMPDLEHAGCILFWGYNPSSARIAHATATVSALKRGARLIVVDPREAGLANKADLWLRPRPGSDGALALGIAHVMIERGWFDRDFVRDWTNGPLLVRADNGRLLRGSDLAPDGEREAYVAWDERTSRPLLYDAAHPALRTGERGSGTRRRIRRAYRRGADCVPSRLRPGPRALPPVFASDRRSDHLGCRPSRSRRPRACCGRHARFPISPGRGGAAYEHDPDRAGDWAALCPDRQLRQPRGQCAICLGAIGFGVGR